jgi:excisionase family DNA binding protein
MEEQARGSTPAGYSIVETARRLSVSRSHVYRLISEGRLRRVKLGARSIVPASEIDRLMVEGAVEPAR